MLQNGQIMYRTARIEMMMSAAARLVLNSIKLTIPRVSVQTGKASEIIISD